MRKSILGITVIIVAGAVTSYYLYLEHDRYKITTSSKGIAYEVDTKTGKSWMLAGKRKVLQEDSKPPAEAIELPLEAIVKIEGNASISNIGYIECDIYNGSDYTITELYVQITVNDELGNEEINRVYMLSPTYRTIGGLPLKNSKFQTDLGFKLNGKKWSWAIMKAKGFRQ